MTKSQSAGVRAAFTSGSLTFRLYGARYSEFSTKVKVDSGMELELMKCDVQQLFSCLLYHKV